MTWRPASIHRTSLAVCLVLATLRLDAQVPARIGEAATKAGISAPVLAWCQGEIKPGRRGYAIAVDGRYLVVDGSGTGEELASFSGKPELSCHSRAQARQLHRDIRRSDTISGEIVPRFDTAVVCGFTAATTATCWQYSPAERAYVEVGGWTT